MRKNAIFTLDKTYNAGGGDLEFCREFYLRLEQVYPGATPVPIPPVWNVRPRLDATAQAFVCGEFLINVLAPRLLDKFGAVDRANEIRLLRVVGDADSAQAAAHKFESLQAEDLPNVAPPRAKSYVLNQINCFMRVVSSVIRVLSNKKRAKIPLFSLAHYVTRAAEIGAGLDPDATWEVVNEMLQAL